MMPNCVRIMELKGLLQSACAQAACVHEGCHEGWIWEIRRGAKSQDEHMHGDDSLSSLTIEKQNATIVTC